MPKFNVLLVRTHIENLTFEISAKDEEAAQAKAEEAIQNLQWSPEKIAAKYKTDWEDDTDDIEIDSVEEQ